MSIATVRISDKLWLNGRLRLSVGGGRLWLSGRLRLSGSSGGLWFSGRFRLSGSSGGLWFSGRFRLRGVRRRHHRDTPYWLQIRGHIIWSYWRCRAAAISQ
ncbi:MAG TPA: hypothetical protein DIW77_15605 [Chromatiaceae bacterium]|nr:MAG: hypothetical protein N838_09690 [Thiohalocapsa sp. PB-PSB1]HCS91420.1 hypothetical protein [Chromatiaceae bacterium]